MHVLNQQDMDIVQLVSPQIAYSLRNAAKYSTEQKRVIELNGLANLVDALGVVEPLDDRDDGDRGYSP